MRIQSYNRSRRERDDYYLELVEGVYDRLGRDGLCRLINVVAILNDIEIKINKHVDENGKKKIA